MTPKVLLIGRNDGLLHTRARIVEQCGAEAICCGPQQLTVVEPERLALSILCHTLAPVEALECVEWVRLLAPSARIVTVLPFWDAVGERAESTTTGIDEIPVGPYALARYVSEVLQPRPGS